jgi:hypothetical protein
MWVCQVGDSPTGIVRTSSVPTEDTLESMDEVGVRDTRRGLDGKVAPEIPRMWKNLRLICAHENKGVQQRSE